MAWFDRLLVHAASLLASDMPVVLAGDYNVVPTDADIYPTKSWAKDALLQPAPRQAFRRLLDQGWVDALRARHPNETIYTFWDYKRDRWRRNAGLRLDHILLSPALRRRLAQDAGVDRDVRGREGASDHAPSTVTLERCYATKEAPAASLSVSVRVTAAITAYIYQSKVLARGSSGMRWTCAPISAA